MKFGALKSRFGVQRGGARGVEKQGFKCAPINPDFLGIRGSGGKWLLVLRVFLCPAGIPELGVSTSNPLVEI